MARSRLNRVFHVVNHIGYCKNSGGDLSKSIGDAGTKIPQLGADIKEAEAKNAQLKEDLKQHQVDRSAAKAAVAGTPR